MLHRDVIYGVVKTDERSECGRLTCYIYVGNEKWDHERENTEHRIREEFKTRRVLVFKKRK